jgi:glycogen phosphorylase
VKAVRSTDGDPSSRRAEFELLSGQVPEELRALVSLALDLRWASSHATNDLWHTIDRRLWDATRNPWLVLQSAGRMRLEQLAQNDAFVAAMHQAQRERDALLHGPGWFARTHPNAQLGGVAYFCMEFGLTGALPIYAGGLGILAGDHLKAACDLGVPLTAVGLLYFAGYFRQMVDEEGTQHELYPPIDPSWLPLQRVRDETGAWLGVPLPLPGRTVTLRAWRAHVGAITLYLLDSNDVANDPDDRRITGELYGGGAEVRLRQELALGIGGWRLLRSLGIAPDVCHLNEGHAAFAIFERARVLAADKRWPFDRALTAARMGNVFTSHTPVAAGFDRFERELIEPYLAAYAQEAGVDPDTLWHIGHERGTTVFNMAHLAIHASGSVNGVSRLHGDVSRHLFSRLFPRWPTAEIPVSHVTNGVHQPSWESPEADALWTRARGKERWRGESSRAERVLENIGDTELWSMRAANRARLVATIRDRGQRAFDPSALTIGWARRFAAYKRPTLILHDADRLARLLDDPDRPVQIVVAGKAHPRDDEGKALLREWAAFSRREGVGDRVALLADYDMVLAESIVQGVDVWLNTPRHPWEASGTSGMKVLVNGGLNLSELDGWWAEAYSPDVGWSFAERRERPDGSHRHISESDALYEVLENEAVPGFYRRDESGLPREWLSRVRRSMERLTAWFSADRMVREYVTDLYVPASSAYRRRLVSGGALASEITEWAETLDAHWHELRFERVEMVSRTDGFEAEAVVHLGSIDPSAVKVELFAQPIDREPPERIDMGTGLPLDGEPGTFIYKRRLVTVWPTDHYTVRIVPYHLHARVPLEQRRILWDER